MFCNCNGKNCWCAKGLMAGSVLAVILAVIGAMGTDFWLASTQWLLIAIFLAVAGVFVLLDSQRQG
ncbi:MAG: hypothetical protein V1858_05550 [Candidatus Gottesmanbacteria bacterium]